MNGLAVAVLVNTKYITFIYNMIWYYCNIFIMKPTSLRIW